MVTKRFTHVRGGRWMGANSWRVRFEVHPRARGAMARPARLGIHVGGSPTCAGGDGQRHLPSPRALRFTHVRGGRWTPNADWSETTTVHPRARGAMVASGDPEPGQLRFTHVRGGRW